MTKEELSFHWDYFTNISKDFEATDRYVSHTSLGSRNNNKTSSLEFLKLLMIICAEFETMCKLINKHIDNTFNLKSKTEMHTLLSKVISTYPEITDIEVTTSSRTTIKPLKNCFDKQNHLTLEWWTAHNLLKHQGHKNYNLATLKNVTNALASLYVLFAYMSREIQDAYIPFNTCTAILSKYTPMSIFASPDIEDIAYEPLEE